MHATSNLFRKFLLSSFLVIANFTPTTYYVSADDVQWGYFGIYGVENWSTIFPGCTTANHSRQSPIEIARAATEENTDLTQINIVRDEPKSPVSMINNGHTVNLDFNLTSVHITGGSLAGRFRVGGVHFHWGVDDTEGSEHTIDAKRFPIEMHVVTFDESRYAGVTQASGGTNSIAVVSVLFQMSSADNPAWKPIVSYLSHVKTPGKPMNIPYFNIQTLLPHDTSRYYRYLGSLTTPPCSESVVWSIFEEHPYISSRQLAEFRKLEELVEADGKIEVLDDNWRMLQPLDGRVIQRSFAGVFTSGINLSFNVMSQLGLIAALRALFQAFL